MRKIWHPWYLWECYEAGFYASCADIGVKKEDAKEQYKVFLSDLEGFENALKHVIVEWKHSCEHFLTDVSRNRIAWLGQAAMVYATKVPSEARGGYKLMTKQQRVDADNMALKYLKIWENENTDKGVYKQMAFAWVS